MVQRTPLGILLGNFLLGIDAFGTPFPNKMKTKMNSWNGRWVIQLGQIINLGNEKGIFNRSTAASVGNDPNQRFNEDLRIEVGNSLQSLAIAGNLQMVMQTVVDIQGALPGMVLDKGIGSAKGLADIFARGWIGKLEKAKSYAENANKLRKTYNGWLGGGVDKAINDYTLLF